MVTAIVICDLQIDCLNSLSHKESLLGSIDIVQEVVQRRNVVNHQKWIVIFSGLRFSQRYENVSNNHKLYGGLKRLNEKLGDDKVHWFMEGYTGSNFLKSAATNDEFTREVWRSTHVPHELLSLVQHESIDKVYLVGAKASGSVQITMQVLVDKGIDVTAIKECIDDSDPKMLDMTLQYILPIYGSVISLREFVEEIGEGMEILSDASQEILAGLNGVDCDTLLASDCKRKGHGSRFIEFLLKRGGWKTYPTQIWYEDFLKGEFYCPLFKKVVDFCDEPEFSKVSMYLSGREYLDEKDKVVEIAGRFMPRTYCIKNGSVINGTLPSDTEAGSSDLPWFVKEADKNLGGTAISILAKPSEIMGVVDRKQRYVVQQHIRNPLLTDQGHKAHLKFYVLLIGDSDGLSWILYTYLGALLSISPRTWSPRDLTHDTQITIHRHPEHPSEIGGWKQHWNGIYEKCKSATAEIVKNAIRQGKLKGRSKKQFEVFSIDWMPDTSGDIWMFEFNMSPAVAQHAFDEESTRDDRRNYLMNHDEVMLRDALSIVFPEDGKCNPGLWDFVDEFKKQDL